MHRLSGLQVNEMPPMDQRGNLLAGCAIECRRGTPDGRFSIGENSVLSCRIVLEREVGKVSVGSNTFIGGGTQIVCANEINIGSDVLISWGCTIVDHDSHSLDWRNRKEDVRRWREGLLTGGLGRASELKDWTVVDMAPVNVHDKSWLGMNVTVVKGVTIGEGCVIAAGSVVTKDVPPWTLAGGNPARAIRQLPNESAGPGFATAGSERIEGPTGV